MDHGSIWDLFQNTPSYNGGRSSMDSKDGQQRRTAKMSELTKHRDSRRSRDGWGRRLRERWSKVVHVVAHLGKVFGVAALKYLSNLGLGDDSGLVACIPRPHHDGQQRPQQHGHSTVTARPHSTHVKHTHGPTGYRPRTHRSQHTSRETAPHRPQSSQRLVGPTSRRPVSRPSRGLPGCRRRSCSWRA